MNIANLILACLFAADLPPENPTVVVVVGTPGNDEYSQKFSEWADNWKSAAAKAQAHFVRIGHAAGEPDPEEPVDRDHLKQELAELAGSQSRSVWLVLIGHGTFDGRRAKFNIRGPDVTAEELAEWIKPLQMPLAVINCASASGPFINHLSGPGRVIVTATKSGSEHNYSRFGEHISRMVIDPSADLDKDGQTSLVEAYLAASAAVQDFYKQESRLATEHALIDDNGDGAGTPADWFRGFRAVRQAKDGAIPDGNRANQFVLLESALDQELSPEDRTKRNDLELLIAQLRSQKSQLSEEDYYRKLEPLLIELAELYRDVEQQSGK